MNAAQEREFVEFVEGNSPRLLRMAELLLGDAHLAEDLVQASLVKLYRVWGRERRADPVAYLRRVMLNTRTDWWRRKSSHELPTAVLPDVTETDHTDAHAHADALQRALAQLTRAERAVLILRYFEDLTEVDAAAALGITAGTIKSTASRALAKLRLAAASGANLDLERT